MPLKNQNVLRVLQHWTLKGWVTKHLEMVMTSKLKFVFNEICLVLDSWEVKARLISNLYLENFALPSIFLNNSAAKMM